MQNMAIIKQELELQKAKSIQEENVKKKMLMIIFGLGLVFLPAGQVKAEELHSDEHSMEAMHSSIEHGQGHSEEHVMGTEEMESKEAVYTCPMHPEVKQDKPGSCPKCAMTLQPVVEQVKEKSVEHHHEG